MSHSSFTIDSSAVNKHCSLNPPSNVPVYECDECNQSFGKASGLLGPANVGSGHLFTWGLVAWQDELFERKMHWIEACLLWGYSEGSIYITLARQYYLRTPVTYSSDVFQWLILATVGTHEFVYYKWQECVVVARMIPIATVMTVHVTGLFLL
jgi:hypothetical protein